MSKITVVKWVNWNDPALKKMDESFGGMGGWFGKDGDDTWETYASSLKGKARRYAEALRLEVRKRDIKRGGDWHQTAPDGVPVFSDNTYASFSYRAWGDLLAAIWTDPEKGKRHSYMDFYMDCLIDGMEAV